VTTPHPSVATLQARFGAAVRRVEVSCGDTIVYADPARVHEILAFLKTDAGERYDYLADITAVEYRDRERPIEVVWQLWSIPRKAALRVKAELPREGPLEVATVTDLWQGANWLEREVWDMFGVRFAGHPDLRRILMWENYAEGHPLRKDFPLRGRFSRSEQVRQALSSDLEAHYSFEELSIKGAAPYLPAQVRRDLEDHAHGGRGHA
jgi:NADH-quinone oxidoreductase subunit C